MNSGRQRVWGFLEGIQGGDREIEKGRNVDLAGNKGNVDHLRSESAERTYILGIAQRDLKEDGFFKGKTFLEGSKTI